VCQNPTGKHGGDGKRRVHVYIQRGLQHGKKNAPRDANQEHRRKQTQKKRNLMVRDQNTAILGCARADPRHSSVVYTTSTGFNGVRILPA